MTERWDRHSNLNDGSLTMKKDTQKLVKIALITSPLLAIYNVAPISLFLQSGAVNHEWPAFYKTTQPFRILIPISFVTFTSLILWLFNIWWAKQASHHQVQPVFRYALSILFTMCLVGLFSLIAGQVRNVPSSFDNLRYFRLFGMVANTVFILIMIDLIISRGKRATLELEKASLLATNLKSRHEQLKQQIHPHFLFNALNTIKLLIKNDEPGAESYTVRLSRFLRASIAQGLEDQLIVGQELEIFKDFMELQMVRFPNLISYEYELSPQTMNSQYLPAFTFQVLAENALKHNAFDQKNPLHIMIREEQDRITFSNNMIPGNQPADSTGIGLRNLSERFRIISDQQLDVEQNKKEFIVRFKAISI